MRHSIRALLVLHLAANAAILSLGYYWLGVGEATAGSLAWNGILGLSLVIALLLVHGSAFAYFPQRADLKGAWGSALRHLPTLFVFAALAASLYWVCTFAEGHTGNIAFRLGSALTMLFRKPIDPILVQRSFRVVFGLIRVAVLPVFLLPLASALATSGWKGFRVSWWTAAKHWRYWIEAPLLLLAAFWLPFQLMAWTPALRNFWLQMASFLVRLLAAYLLCVSAWLSAIFVTSRGIPWRSHPSTLSLP